MNALNVSKTQELFRVIDPAFGPDNIYRFQARKTFSLGPLMIATVAKRQMTWLDAEVINENNYHRSHGGPRNSKGEPDHLELQQKERYASFIGVSASMTNAVPRALEIIQLYQSMPKELQPKAIIVGGWHAGDSPTEFLQAGADVIVHGEGEVIIASLLTALANNQSLENIPGISYRSPDGQIKRNGPEFLIVPQEQMDSLPFPDFGLIRYAKIKVFPVGRTRGCSGKCRFCRVRSVPRSISPARFLQLIKILSSQGVRRFFVVDDRSEEDLKGFQSWLKGVAAFQKERDIWLDFTTQNRLSLAEHPEILKLMRQAGVYTVAIGFESPIPEELRAMRKPIIPAKMLEWAEIYRKSGFLVHMMLILGYPMPPGSEPVRNKTGEIMTIQERARKFWQFIKRAKPDTLQVLLYTPILGTPDWEFLESRNRIYKNLGWRFFDGTWLTFQPDKEIDPRDLQAEMANLMRKFYAFRYIWRFGWVSVPFHLLKIGLATVAMPFIWTLLLPFKKWHSQKAWELPHRIFRNAKRRFQGHLIIMSWQRSFRRLDFSAKLAQLVHTNHS